MKEEGSELNMDHSFIFVLSDLKLKRIEGSGNINCILGQDQDTGSEKTAESSTSLNYHLINYQLYVRLIKSNNTFLSH